MSYTQVTKRDVDDGLVHIAANETGDWWGAACDDRSSMPRLNRSPTLAEIPTCVACHVGDAEWWKWWRKTRRAK